MTKFYYATNEDNGEGVITEDAGIRRFTSKKKMREWLLAGYQNGGWNLASAVIEPGQYSDCWIKSYSQPKRGDSWLEPFAYANDLIVRAPSQNPGHGQYWITPRSPVYVVSRIEEAE